jgi:antitoxin component YwqK of YwqJK toxin-antitoxin module
MKNGILIVAFVSIGLTGIAQSAPDGSDKETEKNKTDAKGKKQGYWEKIDEKTGKLKYKGNFKDGKPVGEFEFYYESGKLKSKLVHMADKKTSRAKIYYESGRIMSVGKYINAKKDSVWTQYDEDGFVTVKPI